VVDPADAIRHLRAHGIGVFDALADYGGTGFNVYLDHGADVARARQLLCALPGVRGVRSGTCFPEILVVDVDPQGP